MNTISKFAITSAIVCGFAAGEVYAATEWNVSLWGKRRALTENVEKLAELVEAKTNGDFKLNISYGGLSKSRENLDGISIGAFEYGPVLFLLSYRQKSDNHGDRTALFTHVSLGRIAEIYTEVFEHPIVKKDLARWNATLLMPSPIRSTTSSAKPIP